MSRARAHRAGTAAGPGVPERIKWRTAARLLGLLLPLKWRMAGVIAATCAFVTLNVAAPKVLGDATDVVVDGFLGGSLDESNSWPSGCWPFRPCTSGRRCSAGSRAA